MTLWAIVPVKPLRRGKSRLAGTLNENERAELNQKLLEQTLTTLSSLKELDQVLVVSRDPQALTIARNHGAKTIQEDGQPQLNTALTRATVLAKVQAIQGVLILPADLPLLTKEDVLTLIDSAAKPPVVVIAPDRHKKGTNALLMVPPGLIDYEFGEDSFQKHSERAKKANAHLEIVELPSLALDVDMPEDLELVKKMESTKV
ncbi:MAG: 2-phospho-L-lactate guanylyltransferase [Anaerolineales bacterium]|nr:2-phospho-L-lactate guanylyltransferase [Anaerolineales bacterium]MBX3038310.1 2-phospho-L-lactate guanylyltransferase [Anaerolineales bacterium]